MSSFSVYEKALLTRCLVSKEIDDIGFDATPIQVLKEDQIVLQIYGMT